MGIVVGLRYSSRLKMALAFVYEESCLTREVIHNM
jgi:hypothetical protein